MNVSAGDVALAIDGDFAGATCMVKASSGMGRFVDTNELCALWHVAFARPMPWTTTSPDWPPNEGVYPDAWLQRMAGEPSQAFVNEVLRDEIADETNPDVLTHH
jgi:hypothetical protein